MGVYQKYRDATGKATGPWFVKYPYRKNPATGRIKYKIEKAGPSKKLAQRIYSARYEEYKKREHLDWVEKQPLTFNQLADWYLELPSVKDRRYYSDVVRYTEGWRKFFENHFGEILVEDIKPSMVETYRQERLKQTSFRGKNPTRHKVAPATVNKEAATLKRMFNLAIREDLADKNPCWKVEKLREDNARTRILSKDEYERLIAELPQNGRDVVVTAYYTGMRAGEILNLTWDRVHLDEGYVQLEAEDTKTRKARRIYLHQEVVEILQRLRKVRHLQHRYVFTYEGHRQKSVQTCFTNACRRAGIEDFRFHDLRHTFNTMMRKAGVPQSVIMQLTGHRTSAMFERYNTVDEEDAMEALKRLNRFLDREEPANAPAERVLP